MCAAIYVGAREGAKRFFFENPDYTVKTIEVQTDGTLQREQILNAADLHEGENIFRVNLLAFTIALQQLPQVDEVQVVRKFPSEIDIRIVERKADRVDHEREGNFRSICVRRCFSGGRARRFDERKEVVAGISRIAADSGMHERVARGRQNRRIVRSRKPRSSCCV